jgi:hypothetical protein
MSTRSIVLFSVLAVLGALVACNDSVGPGHGGGGMVSGQWGGEHVALEADAAGATFEFDCAIGATDTPLVARGGKVQVTGTYTRGSGGPAHEGDKPDMHPALYTGRVERDVLTITITLTDTGQVMGTFTLRRDAPPMMYYCV